MDIKDNVTARGSVKVVLTGADGAVKETRTIENLVVTAGKNFMASRVAAGTPTAMSEMALGTGTTAAAVTDTALQAEIGRVALSSLTASGNVITHTASFGAGVATGAVTEAGIFNDPTAGVMLARTTFAVVNKGANDTMTVTWTVTIN